MNNCTEVICKVCGEIRSYAGCCICEYCGAVCLVCEEKE